MRWSAPLWLKLTRLQLPLFPASDPPTERERRRSPRAIMSVSRQARRQVGRDVKALEKTPLDPKEVASIHKVLAALAGDCQSAAGRCAACQSTSGERKKCRTCGFSRYCSLDCQDNAWEEHKPVCKALASIREIDAAGLTFLVSMPLFSLDKILARLGGGHAEAYEASVHLHALASRYTCVYIY